MASDADMSAEGVAIGGETAREQVCKSPSGSRSLGAQKSHRTRSGDKSVVPDYGVPVLVQQGSDVDIDEGFGRCGYGFHLWERWWCDGRASNTSPSQHLERGHVSTVSGRNAGDQLEICVLAVSYLSWFPRNYRYVPRILSQLCRSW